MRVRFSFPQLFTVILAGPQKVGNLGVSGTVRIALCDVILYLNFAPSRLDPIVSWWNVGISANDGTQISVTRDSITSSHLLLGLSRRIGGCAASQVCCVQKHNLCAPAFSYVICGVDHRKLSTATQVMAEDGQSGSHPPVDFWTPASVCAMFAPDTVLCGCIWLDWTRRGGNEVNETVTSS